MRKPIVSKAYQKCNKKRKFMVKYSYKG